MPGRHLSRSFDDVTAQDHADVGIFASEVCPYLFAIIVFAHVVVLSVIVFALGNAEIVVKAVAMHNKDDLGIRVGPDNAAGPLQSGSAWIKFEQYNEIALPINGDGSIEILIAPGGIAAEPSTV